MLPLLSFLVWLLPAVVAVVLLMQVNRMRAEVRETRQQVRYLVAREEAREAASRAIDA